MHDRYALHANGTFKRSQEKVQSCSRKSPFTNDAVSRLKMGWLSFGIGKSHGFGQEFGSNVPVLKFESERR